MSDEDETSVWSVWAGRARAGKVRLVDSQRGGPGSCQSGGQPTLAQDWQPPVKYPRSNDISHQLLSRHCNFYMSLVSRHISISRRWQLSLWYLSRDYLVNFELQNFRTVKRMFKVTHCRLCDMMCLFPLFKRIELNSYSTFIELIECTCIRNKTILILTFG